MPALGLMIILGIVWASGFAIAGYCMSHGVHPFGYAFWQTFGPFVLLLIIQVVRRDIWLNKAGAAYATLCALFGIVLPNLLMYFAVQYVPSGILTVLANSSPVFIYLLALSFRDERFNPLRMILVGLGLIAIALIVVPNQQDLTLNLSNGWIYIALLIPLSYAFSAVYISRFHPKSGGDVLSYAMWMLLVATLCISPLAVVNQAYYPLRLNDLSSLLIILEIFLSALGYVLLFIIIRRVGAVYYTIVNIVAAVSGVIYGYILFGQKFSALTYLGIILVIATIIGLTYSQQKIKR